jgi:protoporphyrin/coproporphyrin ferrochelatase
MSRTGLLLINLGTPDAPTPAAVGEYLAEFLMDPYVIDIPAPLRWLLVHGVILRKRPADSAALYQKIWTDRGSPLLFHLEDLVARVRAELGTEWVVEGGMRYRRPSLKDAFLRLRDAGVDRVIAFPLYPQYSLAATASSERETRRWANAVLPGKRLDFVAPFYGAPAFLDAFAAVARRGLEGFAHDHVLFSFHGLPERQVRKTDRTGRHCLAGADCCARIIEANRDCYRAQSFHTARELASRLGLSQDHYTVSFQSRLNDRWIRPFTDDLYRELPSRGVRRLAVVSPSFVADCLETLEEIAIRGTEEFRRAGGDELRLIPSLNSEREWVSAVVKLSRDALA